MKKNTYNIFDDCHELISQETYSKKGNLINFRDYSTKPEIEKIFEYDSNNRLTKEIELGDGVEYSRMEIQYNEHNEIISKKLFISNELYESVVTIFTDRGYITETYNNNILAEKLTCEDKTKNNYVLEYFYDENSTEKQVNKFDLKSNSKKTEIYNESNELVALRIENYNSKGNLMRFEELTPNNDKLSESIYEYKKDLLIYERHLNYFNPNFDNEIIYEYDFKNNLIKKEVKAMNGNLLEFHNFGYDSENRLIEENGLSNRVSDSAFGGSNENNQFHIIHEYEN